MGNRFGVSISNSRLYLPGTLFASAFRSPAAPSYPYPLSARLPTLGATTGATGNRFAQTTSRQPAVCPPASLGSWAWRRDWLGWRLTGPRETWERWSGKCPRMTAPSVPFASMGQRCELLLPWSPCIVAAVPSGSSEKEAEARQISAPVVHVASPTLAICQLIRYYRLFSPIRLHLPRTDCFSHAGTFVPAFPVARRCRPPPTSAPSAVPTLPRLSACLSASRSGTCSRHSLPSSPVALAARGGHNAGWLSSAPRAGRERYMAFAAACHLHQYMLSLSQPSVYR